MPSKPMYSFPTLRVALGPLCQMGYHGGNNVIPALIGQAYFFRWEVAADAAKAGGMTLDQSLCFDLAAALQTKPFSSPVLVWFGGVNGAFFLWVCGNRASAHLEPLRHTAGFQESGQDYIRPNAVPFFYWDAQYSYRVHQVDPDIRELKNWVQDFGNLFAAIVSPESPSRYKRIKNNPVEYNEYSAISPDTELVLKRDRRRVVLTQAFIEFTDDPLEEMS